MTERSASELQTLLADQGFWPPELWLDYARRHSFRRVPAGRVSACPDCGAPPARALGQFVYFSHLSRLCECGGCGLVYADLRLPAEVLAGHFERTYKDEAYFAHQRAGVIRQLARMVDAGAGPGAHVLDAGGATGRLMDQVRARRPDLAITLSDISRQACHAAEGAGFRVIRSDLAGLDRLEEAFEVVVLSDVLYMEPAIHRVWGMLPRLVVPGGLLLIRIPNRLSWIRLQQRALRTCAPARADARDRVPLFNPEHLFIFPPRLLHARLRQIGFEQVAVHPARCSRGAGARRALAAAVDAGAWAIHRLPGGPVVSPSLVMAARRRVGTQGACG